MYLALDHRGYEGWWLSGCHCCSRSVGIYGTVNPVHLPNPNPYPTCALTNPNFRCRVFQLTRCSSMAEYWLHKPGVLGLILSSCWPFKLSPQNHLKINLLTFASWISQSLLLQSMCNAQLLALSNLLAKEKEPIIS